MTEWKPIKTCPSDGFFLVCSNQSGWVTEDRHEAYECSVSIVHVANDGTLIGYVDEGDDECAYLDGPATHWMPLPSPPADDQSDD